MFRLSVSGIAFYQTLASETNGAAQQINGCEGETAIFLSNSVKSELCAGSFAPRHLNRLMCWS